MQALSCTDCLPVYEKYLFGPIQKVNLFFNYPSEYKEKLCTILAFETS